MLVGSAMRAITKSRNTASSTTSKPSRSYTAPSTSYSSRELVPQRAARCGHSRKCGAGPQNVHLHASPRHRRHAPPGSVPRNRAPADRQQRSGVPAPAEPPARHRYAQNPHAQPAHRRRRLCASPAPLPRPRRCAPFVRTRAATYPISKPNTHQRDTKPQVTAIPAHKPASRVLSQVWSRSSRRRVLPPRRRRRPSS